MLFRTLNKDYWERAAGSTKKAFHFWPPMILLPRVSGQQAIITPSSGFNDPEGIWNLRLDRTGVSLHLGVVYKSSFLQIKTLLRIPKRWDFLKMEIDVIYFKQYVTLFLTSTSPLLHFRSLCSVSFRDRDILHASPCFLGKLLWEGTFWASLTGVLINTPVGRGCSFFHSPPDSK